MSDWSLSRYIAHGLLVGALSVGNAHAQECDAPPSATAVLDVNDVRALLVNSGGLVVPEPTAYEVPKGSGVRAMYHVGLAVAGRRDTSVAATVFSLNRQSDYRAGPLDDGGDVPVNCVLYDRIWSVTQADIDAYETTGIASSDLSSWPTGLGAPTLSARGSEIDVLDQPINARKDRVINLEAGERPTMFGEQMAWWITNDRADDRADSGDASVGLEVHTTAFASSSVDALRHTTFYRHRIYSRDEKSLADAYVGLFVDGDIGFEGDDFMGTDTLLQMAFFYNGDNDDDDVGGAKGYREAPPAVGVTFLQSPVGLTQTIPTWGSHHWPDGYPITSVDHYNRLQGRWIDSTRMTLGGDGYGGAGPVANYVFPDDPGLFWSELALDAGGLPGSPSDRSLAMSSGPFTFDPNDEVVLSYAIVWSRSTDNLASVTQLKSDVEEVRRYWEATVTSVTVSESAENERVVDLEPAYPNPFDDAATMVLRLREPVLVELTLFDLLGREVRRLLYSELGQGVHSVAVHGETLPDGLYFVRLRAGHQTEYQRIIRRATGR